MNNYLDYNNEQYKILNQLMSSASTNFLELQNSIREFSKQLQSIGEHIHELISEGTGEDDIMVSSYQQLSNFILRYSQSQENLALSLKTEVVEPYQTFVNNFRETNHRIKDEVKKSLKELDQAREQLIKSQANYVKSMSNAEKGSFMVEKIVDGVEKGNKTKDDLLKVSERTVKLKEYAEEAQQDYKKLIEITNKRWVHLESYIEQQLLQASLNEQQRIKFCRQTLWSLIKIVGDDQLIKIFDEKFSEIESKAKDQSQMNLRRYIERLLKKKGVNQPLQKHEDFVSFDQWKKIQLEDQIDPAIMGGWQVIGDSISEQERMTLDSYITTLMIIEKQNNYPNDLLKLLESSSFFSSSAMDSENEEEKSFNDEQRQRLSSANSSSSDRSIQSTSSTQFLLFLKQLFTKQIARTYFLDVLSKEIKNLKSCKLQIYYGIQAQYIYLNDECYIDLVQVYKNIIHQIDLNEQFDCEELYKFLNLSTKIIRKSTSANLICSLSMMDIWQKQQRWHQLYNFIYQKRHQEKNQKELAIKNFIKKGMGFIGKGIKLITGQQEKQQISEYDFVYLVIEEINLLIINLQLKSQLAFDIVCNLALNHSSIKLEKYHLSKLLSKQEDRNVSNLRYQLTTGKLLKQHREKKFIHQNRHALLNKMLFAFKKSLVYIGIYDQPKQLLLLNRFFNQNLKKKVATYYLLTSKPNQHNENMKVFLNVHQNDLDYIGMKVKVGIDMEIHQSSVEEIITMDVQRSLQIHSKQISSSILQSLLRTYAYFNSEVSYCQGMNYLAGYLFLSFRDEQITYKAFDTLINNYFKTLFIKDFELMKMRFYQFEKLFALYLPKLCDHFKQEKLDASYYITPWMITLFTQVYQFALKSIFLNMIWDIFLAESWKGFYKCVLFILKYYEKMLLQMSFDEILHYLGDIIKGELFTMPTEKDLQELIQDMLSKKVSSVKQMILQSFPIRNSLLQHLESEYHCFITNFNEKMSKRQNQQ